MRSGLRHCLLLAHRWVGLLLAGFLVVAGLTGSVLAFGDELDALLNPDWFVGGPARPTMTRLLPVDALVAAAERDDPAATVTRVLLPEGARRSVLLYAAARDEASPLAYDQAFLDGETGHVLGRRDSQACCLAPEVLIPFILRLHATLTLGSPGRWVMGAVALLWSVDCFVGLALTLPRARPLLRRWASAWRVKRTRNPFRLTFDLHRAGGLWCWGALLTLAVSGVALTLYAEVFLPVVATLLPTTERVEPVSGTANTSIGFDAAMAEAGPGQRALWAYRWNGTIVVGSRTDGHSSSFGFGPDETEVDAGSGKVLARRRLATAQSGDLVLRLQYPLHSGQVAGRIGQVGVCTLGLATAGLASSGVWLWWRKRRSFLLRRWR